MESVAEMQHKIRPGHDKDQESSQEIRRPRRRPKGDPSPSQQRPKIDPWRVVGSLGCMVLILLVFIVELIFAIATLLPTLHFGLESQRTLLGVDSNSGLPAGIIVFLIVVTVAPPLLFMIAGWFFQRRLFFASAAVWIMTLIAFSYSVYSAGKGNFVLKDKIAQQTSDAGTEVDRRAQRLRAIDLQLPDKREKARFNTPDEVEALIAMLTTKGENRPIWERSRQCQRGYVSSQDGKSEKLCEEVEGLRNQLAAARKVEELEKEQKELWAADTVPVRDHGADPLRTDSSTEGWLTLVDMVFSKEEADTSPEQREELRRRQLRYLDAFGAVFAAGVFDMIGPWMVFTAFGMFGWRINQARARAQQRAHQGADEGHGSGLAEQGGFDGEGHSKGVSKGTVMGTRDAAQSHAATPVATAHATYLIDQNPVKSWASNRLEIADATASATESATALQEDCELWCRTHNIPLTGHWKRELKAVLEGMGMVHLPRTKPVSYRGARLKAWEGIKAVK